MARSYKRDGNGRFSGGGGTSNPKGTVPKGGRGVRGSVARSVQATEGKASPAPGGKAKLASKAPAKPKVSAAERKSALVKRVSSDALAGKKISPAKRNYVRAQQTAKVEAQKAQGGKGSKAARRIAKMRRK